MLTCAHSDDSSGGVETRGHFTIQCMLTCAIPMTSPHSSGLLFKFEPFVLHVSCRSLEDGQLMLKAALAAGYKNSGMIVGKRIMVNVRGTLKLEVPVVYHGEMVVTKDYIRTLVQCSTILSLLVVVVFFFFFSISPFPFPRSLPILF